ncbi:hypothetical protein [Ancylomarina sp. 16SWW S1-10-2]|uniref:hypothetical protein n=1 Tax=Ancylomarina sp. 16SWW S1-10-2 TaxID=2499681 RepID=UPI0012AE6532|nr:hypothetical protein [Ancylomarina sp. 16SWW S1-10-2]MRT92582.1 hypothetical protein [Ancylomarina sp. 16SWW S1-10-2]
MTFLKNLIITLLLNFIFLEVYCQTDLSTIFPVNIKSTTLDTIKMTDKNMIINVLWLSDTIRLSVSNERTDTSSLKKNNRKGYFASRGFILTERSTMQNCFSYALEKYFENSETYRQNIFRETTTIDRVSIEKILNNSFIKIAEFTTKPRRNLKKNIPNDVILAFVNDIGLTIHAVYYRDEIFYTKNGGFESDTFESLNKFIKKTYWDTQTIKVYQFDKTKLNLSLKL